MKPEIRVLYDPRCKWWEWSVYHPNGNEVPFYESGLYSDLDGALVKAHDMMLLFMVRAGKSLEA